MQTYYEAHYKTISFFVQASNSVEAQLKAQRIINILDASDKDKTSQIKFDATTDALIRRAVDKGSSDNEARNSAIEACRRIFDSFFK